MGNGPLTDKADINLSLHPHLSKDLYVFTFFLLPRGGEGGCCLLIYVYTWMASSNDLLHRATC